MPVQGNLWGKLFQKKSKTARLESDHEYTTISTYKQQKRHYLLTNLSKIPTESSPDGIFQQIGSASSRGFLQILETLSQFLRGFLEAQGKSLSCWNQKGGGPFCWEFSTKIAQTTKKAAYVRLQFLEAKIWKRCSSVSFYFHTSSPFHPNSCVSCKLPEDHGALLTWNQRQRLGHMFAGLFWHPFCETKNSFQKTRATSSCLAIPQGGPRIRL